MTPEEQKTEQKEAQEQKAYQEQFNNLPFFEQEVLKKLDSIEDFYFQLYEIKSKIPSFAVIIPLWAIAFLLFILVKKLLL